MAEAKKIDFNRLLNIPVMSEAEWAAHDEKIRQAEEKEEAARMRAAYEETVPERFFNTSLDSYQANDREQQWALEICRQFIAAVVNNNYCNLLLMGPVGTGKTHLACGILRECGGIYRSAAGIVEELRRGKSFTSKETEADILKRYAEEKLLVIDEVGRGAFPVDEQYMLYQVINARYNTRRPTVLVSNYTKDDFINYIGAATADRLIECVYSFEFGQRHESYRVKVAKGV